MKKITIELNQFKKLGRMRDFALANLDRFASGTPVAETLPTVISAVSQLSALSATQASAENRLRELSRTKATARSALAMDVEFLYHTARAIATESPGFDDKFCLSLRSEAKLLNAARSAVQDATPVADVFIKHAMPADFLEKLNTTIRNFEQACEEYDKQKAAAMAVTSSLQSSLQAARGAASRFDAIVRNTLRGDPALLEAWKRICRIPRASRAAPAEDLPASPPPTQAPPA